MVYLKTATSYVNRLNSYVELGGKIVFFVLHSSFMVGILVALLF